MAHGLIELPVWGYVLVALALTHVTIVSVTLYLHRCQAHRALELHPVVSHFFRFWLWLTTGMGTKEWTAVHRRHHARVETAEDPHSPQVHGIGKVLWEGAELYRVAADDGDTLNKYGVGTPDDWMERNIYNNGRNSWYGIALMLVIDLIAFGPIGLTIWAVQMVWIPFFAAGIINGVGHYWGYRNYTTADTSTNIVPIGILVGGEELHNNHHAFASSARFSTRWWEFDVGWMYIRLLAALGLVKVKRLPPKLLVEPDKHGVDAETVQAVVSNRLNVMTDYARQVVARVHKEELRNAVGHNLQSLIRPARDWLTREDFLLDEASRKNLSKLLSENRALNTVYQYRQQLAALWTERSATQESWRLGLQDWCRRAEDTGIAALAEFARSLRGYTLVRA